MSTGSLSSGTMQLQSSVGCNLDWQRTLAQGRFAKIATMPERTDTCVGFGSVGRVESSAEPRGRNGASLSTKYITHFWERRTVRGSDGKRRLEPTSSATGCRVCRDNMTDSASSVCLSSSSSIAFGVQIPWVFGKMFRVLGIGARSALEMASLSPWSLGKIQRFHPAMLGESA